MNLKIKKRNAGIQRKLITLDIPLTLHKWLKKKKYNMTAVFEQKCKELGWNGKFKLK